MGRDSLTKDTKHKLESDAILKMKSMLESANSNETADSLHSLWLEYETQSSQEAKLAKDLDRYDMILQALEYEMRDNAPRKLQSFFDSTEGCFKFACVKNLVQVLYDKRKQFQELFAQQWRQSFIKWCSSLSLILCEIYLLFLLFLYWMYVLYVPKSVDNKATFEMFCFWSTTLLFRICASG